MAKSADRELNDPREAIKAALGWIAEHGGLSARTVGVTHLRDLLAPVSESSDPTEAIIDLITRLAKGVVDKRRRLALLAALGIPAPASEIDEAYTQLTSEWHEDTSLRERVFESQRAWIAAFGTSSGDPRLGKSWSDFRPSERGHAYQLVRRWWTSGRDELVDLLIKALHPRKATTAPATQTPPVAGTVESPRGRIDSEEVNYFLDKHGCIVRSEHILTITALQKGWDKVGPLVRLWRGEPAAYLAAEELHRTGTAKFPRSDPLTADEVLKAANARTHINPLDVAAISMPQLIGTGTQRRNEIGLVGHDRIALTIGLPSLTPYRPHVIAWTMSYGCRGDDTTGKIERAELFYTSPVAQCVLHAWPPNSSIPILVRCYDRVVPAREDTRGYLGLDIGLGDQSNYLDPNPDGSYSAEFRDLQPLRYYGLEWWWGPDPHGLGLEGS